MGLDAILMMAGILLVVWGGFVYTLVIAIRQERRARKEKEVGRDENA